MRALAQTALPFKIEATDALLTANAGLALFGELVHGLGLSRWLAQEMPRPGSGGGYEAQAYVEPLVLMLAGGGRSLADLRMLKRDAALATALEPDRLPSTDAVGDWPRRMGQMGGLEGLARVDERIVAMRIEQAGVTEPTLDADASQIVAEKKAAHFTDKGSLGYLPMIGHLAEADVIVHDEFRAGSVAPASDTLGLIEACEARLPPGHRIAHVRPDAAGYQAEVFDRCEDTGKRFAIGARLDAATRRASDDIPESACQRYADCAVAETVHSMGGTKKALRPIVVKYLHQGELFDEQARYHVIASNRVESAQQTLLWYRQRGAVSENGIEELEIGFGMQRMPCGHVEANAVFLRIGAIAHNLFVLFEHAALDAAWQRHTVASVRWRPFHLPGKLVRHAGAWVLKVAAERVDLFRSIRARSFAVAQAMAP